MSPGSCGAQSARLYYQCDSVMSQVLSNASFNTSLAATNGTCASVNLTSCVSEPHLIPRKPLPALVTAYGMPPSVDVFVKHREARY